MEYTLTLWRLADETAVVASRTTLNCSRADALEALEAVREGLPPGYGAGLTDAQGRNVDAK